MLLFIVTRLSVCLFFVFKQKTAYEMRISDWSSDVCSSDLVARVQAQLQDLGGAGLLVGGFSGAPYKLYAVQAASAGLGLPVFIACSIVARGARFLAVALLAHGIARWATDRKSTRLNSSH